MKFVVNNCPFYIGLFNAIVLFNLLLLCNKCLNSLLFNSSKKRVNLCVFTLQKIFLLILLLFKKLSQGIVINTQSLVYN